MLNRRNRLLTSDEFRTVQRRGRKKTVSGALIVVLKTPDQHPARFGFVVPKAVGGAVVRNRVKRKLRAAAATITSDITGCDVVVRATPSASVMTFADWSRELRDAVREVRG